MQLLNSIRKRLTGHRTRPTYNSDGLVTYGKNTSFLREPKFLASYHRGIHSGHNIGNGVQDIHIEWRVYVACWAAANALKLPGDFVECGVNTGIMSLAICNYLDFNQTGRRFFLFDTFAGIPIDQMNDREKLQRGKKSNHLYFDCFETAKANFAPYRNATLIRGTVPETLNQVTIDQVCYLSIDMNIAYPELEALRHFWPRLVPGAIVLFDDYGFHGHENQKEGVDEFADQVGCEVLTMPTGQGLLIKPPIIMPH